MTDKDRRPRNRQGRRAENGRMPDREERTRKTRPGGPWICGVLLGMILIGLSTGVSWGQTSHIDRARASTLSELDFFLFKVMLGENFSKRPPAVFSGLDFDYTHLFLYIFYRLDVDETGKGFRMTGEQGRKEFLKKTLDQIARDLGAGKGKQGGSLREGGTTLIRVEVTKPGLDKPAFYNEIADRTILVLRAEHLGVQYEMRRLSSGEFEFGAQERP